MRPFRRVVGPVAALDRPNVDTDQIIPKQFLKRIERSGYGPFLFFDWRYLRAVGGVAAPLSAERLEENPDFELNRSEWRHAPILLAGRNFGCGSSREHAVWALEDWGVRTVVAPSFGDIFASNAVRVGLLPVCLPEERVERWMRQVQEQPGLLGAVDLEAQRVEVGGESAEFTVDPETRRRLLGGLDEVALALRHEGAISAHEARRPAWMPTASALGG